MWNANAGTHKVRRPKHSSNNNSIKKKPEKWEKWKEYDKRLPLPARTGRIVACAGHPTAKRENEMEWVHTLTHIHTSANALALFSSVWHRCWYSELKLHMCVLWFCFESIFFVNIWWFYIPFGILGLKMNKFFTETSAYTNKHSWKTTKKKRILAFPSFSFFVAVGVCIHRIHGPVAFHWK